MDDKTRLNHIKSVVIRPKKNGQIKNLYNMDFEFLLKQAEEVERLKGFIETLQVVHFTELHREKATVERYEKALKEIADSKADSSCNELAMEYEVIAEKALYR